MSLNSLHGLRLRVGAAASVGLAFLLGTTPSARAQSDNFNSGTDSGWTRYDPLAPYGGQSQFTFPNGAYRIQAGISPAPDPVTGVGPSRAGSLRMDHNYNDFSVSVDLVNWTIAHDEAIGLLARVSNPGLGTTNGYALTFDPSTNSLDLSVITGENPNGIAPTAHTPVLNQGVSYRLVFTGNGSQLSGGIYLSSDLFNPLATISATDTTYASGFAGLVVYDNTNAPASNGADGSFDNYVAFPEPAGGFLLAMCAGALLSRRR